VPSLWVGSLPRPQIAHRAQKNLDVQTRHGRVCKNNYVLESLILKTKIFSGIEKSLYHLGQKFSVLKKFEINESIRDIFPMICL